MSDDVSATSSGHGLDGHQPTPDAEPTATPAATPAAPSIPAAPATGQLDGPPAAAPVKRPVVDDDELDRVTAELRRLQAKQGLRPTQVALLVVLALIAGALIAPLWLMTGDRADVAAPSDDPAIGVLRTYERSLDGHPDAVKAADEVRDKLLVRTTDDGATKVATRGADGTCWTLTIPAVAAPGTPNTTEVVQGADTDCR